jgi:hypothetical protein
MDNKSNNKKEDAENNRIIGGLVFLAIAIAVMIYVSKIMG